MTPSEYINEGSDGKRPSTDPASKVFLITDVEKLQARTSSTKTTNCSNIKDQKTDVFEIDRKDIVSDNQKEVSDKKDGDSQ